jgi:ABC-2 type transport system permease protein
MVMVRKALYIVHALWLGEMLRFWRAKSRMIGALATPLTYLVFLAPGLIAGFNLQSGGINIGFFAPGFIGMTVLMAALFGGGAIIWEREFGILKGTLVAPISRVSAVLGKAMGFVTITLIQGIMILIFAALIGVHYVSVIGVLAAIIVMFLAGIGFIGFGIALASIIEGHEGFQMIMGFMTMPLVLLSGAFFPIGNLPVWLQALIFANPLTYAVEALRWFLLGNAVIPITLSIPVITLFAVIMLLVAAKLFGRMKIF